MAKSKKSRKVFYSMGEVSEMFDVNPSLIRFWEKRFDILRPKKNAKGNRLFTPEDVENLKVIYNLVKERGMTLSGAEKYMKDSRINLKHDVGAIEILQRVRSTLVDIKTELESEAKRAGNEIIIRSEQVVPEEITFTEEMVFPVNIVMPVTENSAMINGGNTTISAGGSDTAFAPRAEEPEKSRFIELSLFDF